MFLTKYSNSCDEIEIDGFTAIGFPLPELQGYEVIFSNSFKG